jgi:hypothetical protein
MSTLWFFTLEGLLLVTNLVLLIVTGSIASAIVVGFCAGIMFMMAVTLYFDRKINREIMRDIETLTRNYDNQMTMNFGENNDR